MSLLNENCAFALGAGDWFQDITRAELVLSTELHPQLPVIMLQALHLQTEQTLYYAITNNYYKIFVGEKL